MQFDYWKLQNVRYRMMGERAQKYSFYAVKNIYAGPVILVSLPVVIGGVPVSGTMLYHL